MRALSDPRCADEDDAGSSSKKHFGGVGAPMHGGAVSIAVPGNRYRRIEAVAQRTSSDGIEPRRSR